MTDTELETALSVLVGSRRKAKALLAATSLRHLAEARPDELEHFMPRETGRRFAAALHLARAALSPLPAKTLEGPAEAYAHLFPYLAGREAERFVAVACDCRYHALATTIVAEGSPVGVEVRPADVFANAVRHRAVAVVLAHNHPSGCPTPSIEDYALTERLVAAGTVLGIQVLDHLVIGGNGFASIVHGDLVSSAKKAASSRSTY
ncbi:MAG: yicR [Myxococcales bacterium]|nr:yicR [Myxococcales bacterium]